MFGFLFQRDRDKVRQVLSKHMNRDFVKKFQFGQRTDPRGAFCQPVWVVPVDDANEPGFDSAVAMITKDISPEGVSLISTEPFELPKMLVGFGDSESMEFVQCTLEHCTPVGLGFYQIGLQPRYVANVSPTQVRRLGAVAVACEA